MIPSVTQRREARVPLPFRLSSQKCKKLPKPVGIWNRLSILLEMIFQDAHLQIDLRPSLW